MFVVPISRKISWSNPPFVTLAIIALNVVVFLLLQTGDEERFQRAEDFYRSSGLSHIEAECYVTYVNAPRGAEPAAALGSELKRKGPEAVRPAMRADTEFLALLQSGRVIVVGDANYPEWHRLRLEYEGLLAKVVGIHYALIPAQLKGWNLLTHMFLHGGLAHLLGNMVFLWLVGCVIEMGCGRVAYTALYFLGGLGAAGLYTLVYLKSTVPCIGASGAIAGLMGAYTVLYGKQRIKVFYSLGFFFNYTTVPAILLLPFWLGNEVFGLVLGSYGNVAYVAHLGGLLSGVTFGFVMLRFTGVVDRTAFADDPASRIPALMENALKFVSQLELQQARPILVSVLGIDPEHRQALKTLFAIDKQEPGNAKFDGTAVRLLGTLCKNRNLEELHEYYAEYCRLASSPRLDPDLLLAIAGLLPVQGHHQEAERILASLLRTQPKNPKLPPAILRLGRDYLKNGMREKGNKCLQVVGVTYPGSPEARTAAELLKGLS